MDQPDDFGIIGNPDLFQAGVLQPTHGTNALPEDEADKIADDPRFNTILDAAEEPKFQAWKQRNAPDDSGYDYDLRGAYKAGESRDPLSDHMDDKFKKPNHPTFSTFSNYAALAPDKAGTWTGPDGDQYVPASAASPEVTGIYGNMNPVYDGPDTQPAPAEAEGPGLLGFGGKSAGQVLLDSPYAGTMMNMARGAASGVEMVGALIEGFGDDTMVGALGAKAREAGVSLQEYIKRNMSPEWRASADKLWLDTSKDAAWKDPRAVMGGIASQVPMMVAGLVGGEAAAGGLVIAGLGRAGAQALGYATTGALMSAGDAASSAAQSADEAGLNPEQRRKAERVAGLLGGAVGAMTGPVLGRVMGGETGGRLATAVTALAEQGVEESATQASAEYAKTQVGLPFDWKAVAEAGVQGLAVGGPFGVAAGIRNTSHKKAEKEAADRANADAAAATLRTAAEAERVRGERTGEAAAKFYERQRELAEEENRRYTAEGWRNAPQGASESAPVPGAQRPGPAAFGPPRPGAAVPDFVAGMDPTAKRAEDRGLVADHIVSLGAQMVDQEDKIRAETDKAKRAKLVGEYRQMGQVMASLKTEWHSYQPEETPQAAPAGPPPNFNVSPLPARDQTPSPALAPAGQLPAGADATAAYTAVVGRMHAIQSALAGGAVPEARARLLAQFRELNKQAHALRGQLDANSRDAPDASQGAATPTPPSTQALPAPAPVAGVLPAPALRLAPPSARDLGLPGQAERVGRAFQVRPTPEVAAEARNLTREAGRRETLGVPDRLAPHVVQLEADLQELQRKIAKERRPGVRGKLVGEFRDRTTAYRRATADLNAAVASRNSAMGEGQVQAPLPGLDNTAGQTEVDLAALGAQLDAAMPPIGEDARMTRDIPGLSPLQVRAATATVEPPPPPLVASINASVRRSQAAVAREAAKAARRAEARGDQGRRDPEAQVTSEVDAGVAGTDQSGQVYDRSDIHSPVDGEASAPPQPAPVQAIPAQSRMTASMGAELQALRDRFPTPPGQQEVTTPGNAPPAGQGSPLVADPTGEGPNPAPDPGPPRRASQEAVAAPLAPSKVERAKRSRPVSQQEFVATAGLMNKVKAQVDVQSGNPDTAEVELPDPTLPVWKSPEQDDAPIGVLQAALQMNGDPTSHTATAPRNVLARLLANGPVNVVEVLDHLRANFQLENSPRVVALIDKLQRAFPHTAAKPSSVMVEHRLLTNGFQGLYDPKSDHVSIDLDQAEDPLEAVLHEIVHAAVITRSRTNPDFKRRLRNLVLEAKKHWDDNGFLPPADQMPGFQDHEEFIARALTSTEFNDRLASLYSASGGPEAEGGERSIWQHLKRRIAAALGVGEPTPAFALLDRLLEFIPDASFLQEAANRSAVLAELDRLGLDSANAFMSTLMSILRPATVQVVNGRVPPNGRVLKKLLRVYTGGMIANSWGKYGKSFLDKRSNTVVDLSDAVNRVGRLLDAKAGWATNEQLKGSKIVEVFKNALAGNPDSELGALGVKARMYQLDPAKPSTDAANVYGMSQPGSARAYAELSAMWGAMGQAEKDTYELMRDHADSLRYSEINNMMIKRMEKMVDPAAAGHLADYIATRTPRISSAIGASYNIDLSFNPLLTSAEVNAQVNRLMPAPAYNDVQRDRVRRALNEVHDLVKKTNGPYFPLRRYGRFFSSLKSDKQTRAMSRGQLDAMVADDRENGLGTLMVDEVKPLGPGGGQVLVSWHHEQVEAFDSEKEALRKHRGIVAEWAAAAAVDGRVLKDENNKAGVRRENIMGATGMSEESIDALRREMVGVLGPGSGDMASNVIADWALNRLPATSVKKSRMHARRVSGASTDLMRAYSDYVLGTSYYQAQLVYGSEINKALSTDLSKDVAKMQAAGSYTQAIDLQELGNELKGRLEDFVKTSSADRDAGNLKKMWRLLPNVAATWLLTGFGSMIANTTQVPQMSFNYLGARHGFRASAAALWTAYRDVTPPLAKATGKDWARARFSKIPGAVKAVVKGQPTPSIRDPRLSGIDAIRNRLASLDEKELIDDLAANRKLDFGQVADIQSIASDEGRLHSAVSYLSEAAFVAPQAVESLNRAVTALASYRLNKAKWQAANPGAAFTRDVYDELVIQVGADVDATQFNYGRENKSPVMQNETLRAALVFKTYAAHMVYTVGHNFMEMIGAETKEQKVVAAKFLAGYGAMTLSMAGAAGIVALEPIYLALTALMWAFGSDDRDPEQYLRELMAEWPQFLRDATLKGAPYALGVDTSRLGMAQILPLTDIVRALRDPATGKQEAFTTLGVAIAGAPGSIVADMGTGAAKIANGQVAQGLVDLAPKAFGINDTVRAINYAAYGAMNGKGETYLGADEIGWMGAFTRFMGFAPSSVSEKQAQQSMWYQKRAVAHADRQSVVDAYAQAVLTGKSPQAAIKDAIEFSKAHPEQRITKQTLLGAVKHRQQRAYQVATTGVPGTSKADKLLALRVGEIFSAGGGSP